MKVLELFAGSRSIGKAAQQLNMEVFSTDIKAFEGIDLQADIFDLSPEDIPFVPDIIWASPPCTGFSVASCWLHWKKVDGVSVPATETARLGIRMVKKTMEFNNQNESCDGTSHKGLLLMFMVRTHMVKGGRNNKLIETQTTVDTSIDSL